jgi:threonylcarbamoyladenosine tRNA methylthiotransferase MtaB
VRPHVSSRPLAHVLDEVRRLVDNGYREIVLTGIHLGHYGVEGNWNKPRDEWLRLATLVRELAKLPGDFRIRLSSIEATEVTRDLVAVMAEFPERVAPHLHICLQSGSDAVLRRMRRRWGSRRFIDRCHLVCETLDNPAITTDIIVGFPGESDDDFAATCSVARECGFSKIHIFPFSPRKGTPAAELTGMVTAQVKSKRCERLAEIERELRIQYFTNLLGRRLTVLVEGTDETLRCVRSGTSCRYAPVEFDGLPTIRAGSLVDVTAARLSDCGSRILATANA